MNVTKMTANSRPKLNHSAGKYGVLVYYIPPAIMHGGYVVPLTFAVICMGLGESNMFLPEDLENAESLVINGNVINLVTLFVYVYPKIYAMKEQRIESFDYDVAWSLMSMTLSIFIILPECIPHRQHLRVYGRIVMNMANIFIVLYLIISA